MGNHTVTTNSLVTCRSMEEDSNRSLGHTQNYRVERKRTEQQPYECLACSAKSRLKTSSEALNTSLRKTLKKLQKRSQLTPLPYIVYGQLHYQKWVKIVINSVRISYFPYFLQQKKFLKNSAVKNRKNFFLIFLQLKWTPSVTRSY